MPKSARAAARSRATPATHSFTASGSCPATASFANRRRSVFDASGTSEGNGTPRFYDDRIARYFLYLLGHPTNEMEFVHWVVNGDDFKLRENHEPISNDFLNRNWDDGSDGTLVAHRRRVALHERQWNR